MNRGTHTLVGVAAALAATIWLLLAGRPAAAQFGRATPTPVGTATVRPAATVRATATPTATVTLTGTPNVRLPTPTPPAFVLLPAPSVKEHLAGDVVTAPGVLLSGVYPSIFGDRVALAMANLRDTSAGAYAGDGIDTVTFTILDTANGAAVHTRVARDDRCAFGAQGSQCRVLDLAASNYYWPGGAAARSGHYLLVATAQGAIADHKGTWTLPFEVRLARDGFQDLDGAARIYALEQDADGWIVTVESFGFAPLTVGTHLHLYGAASVEATAPAPGAIVIEFPDAMDNMRVGDWTGSVRIVVPTAALNAYVRFLCVAVAHPDHTLLAGRGQCVALGR